MANKIIGVRAVSGSVFYGYVKNGRIDGRAVTIPNDVFEIGLIDYLRHSFRTYGFTKPYVINLSEANKKYKITVEVLEGDDE